MPAIAINIDDEVQMICKELVLFRKQFKIPSNSKLPTTHAPHYNVGDYAAGIKKFGKI